MPDYLEEEYFNQHPATIRSRIVDGVMGASRRIRRGLWSISYDLVEFFQDCLPTILVVLVLGFVGCLVGVFLMSNKDGIYGGRVDGEMYPANYLVCLTDSPSQFYCSSVSTGKEGLDLVLLGGQKVTIHGLYVIFEMEKKTVSEWKRMTGEIDRGRIVGVPPQKAEKP